MSRSSPQTPSAALSELGARRSEEHQSLALRALLGSLDRRRKCSILDLGPALNRNVEFFSEYRCTLSIADLYRTWRLEQQATLEVRLPFERACQRLLEFDAGSTFDVILAWDLFNYLEKPEIQSLVDTLLPHCQTGTVIFALIATRKKLSAQPLSYSILDSQNLLYEKPTIALRECPQYKEPELTKIMPHFSVDTTFLLRNGIQEYLFEHRP